MLALNRMVSRSLKWTLIGLGVCALAFLSWPKFELFQCRSLQSEAKAQLWHLYEAEKFYYAYHHTYTSLETLIQEGLVKSSEKNYTYQTVHHDTKQFQIIAIGKTLLSDRWVVDQAGDIRALQNACIHK